MVGAVSMAANSSTCFNSFFTLNFGLSGTYNLRLFSFVVCDDTCREVIMDPTNELLVCTISGHCFDRLLSPSEMEPDTVSLNVL